MHFKSDGNRADQTKAQPAKGTNPQNGISEEEIKRILADIFSPV